MVQAQNAGGVDLVLAEMWRSLPPKEQKLWHTRAVQGEFAGKNSNPEVHRTGAPKFGVRALPFLRCCCARESVELSAHACRAKGNMEDGPGFLGGPDQPAWRDPRQRSKVGKELLREERAIRRDRSKPHGRQNRAGRTDDVGSALMTSTQRKKRIERRISQRVKAQSAPPLDDESASSQAAGRRSTEILSARPAEDSELVARQRSFGEWLDRGGHAGIETPETPGLGRQWTDGVQQQQGQDDASTGRREIMLPRGRIGVLREAERHHQRVDKKRQLLETWAQTDSDGSGFLGHDEVEMLVIKMHRGISKNEVSRALEEMDGDGSGEVSFGEFQSWWQSQTRASPPGMRAGHVTFAGAAAESKSLSASGSPAGSPKGSPTISPTDSRLPPIRSPADASAAGTAAAAKSGAPGLLRMSPSRRRIGVNGV